MLSSALIVEKNVSNMIREANMNDLDKLFPIFKEGFIYHYEGRKDVFQEPNDLILRDELINHLSSMDYHYLIIIKDDEIIGYAKYKIKERNKYKVLFINELIITETMRHKGYGKMMMDYLTDIGKKLKVRRIELECWSFNTNAYEMYEHLGFKPQRVVLEQDL